ncbi:MAG TPA: chemotaxis protein CheB [Hanamia sp.]|nr:chemotaxis protein CheB [Hanamia sp.]
MEEETPKFVVVIGTSAGGFFALAELVSQLDDEMDAAFFVVMHLSKKGIGSYLVNQMQEYTPLFCQEAEDNMPIRKGNIYFSQPNKHLIIKDKIVKLGCGPAENRWRPAIDVMFRSAAAAYDGHTIGIILTGMLDDGAAGMVAIKRCGGTCIVQDPNEAEYPDMPLSVLEEIDVDYCIPLSKMGGTILKIITAKEPAKTKIPADIIKEVKISEEGIGSIDDLQALGACTYYCCPDCGGVLFELKNDSHLRYRCHIGHTFSVNDLLSKQNKSIESSMWVTLRAMEERKKLLSQLIENNHELKKSGQDYHEKVEELQHHVDTLKTVLLDVINEEKATEPVNK